MLLSVKNFAKIKEADIELNGITVIAGENNTGKSTIGKILYCLFDASCDLDSKIENEKMKSIYSVINNFLKENFNFGQYEFINMKKDIVKKCIIARDKFLVTGIIMEVFDDYKILVYKKDIENLSQEIFDIINIDISILQKIIFKKYFISEFQLQLNYLNDVEQESVIELNIGKNICNINIKNNDIINVENNLNITSSPIYIDNPFVIDEIQNNNIDRLEHKSTLITKLKYDNNNTLDDIISEALNTEKLDTIMSEINQIATGQFVRLGHNIAYQEKGFEKPIHFSNLSTGLKTFVILQRLLQNGSLTKNTLLILDEPEIHLHPQWQVAFAKILVLLNKKLGINILLNTHSPYFLNAVEIYSAKNEIADKCKYYLAELKDFKVYIKDVTTQTDFIYRKLAKPLQDLEKMQYRMDKNEL